jgi:hypothetical protein
MFQDTNTLIPGVTLMQFAQVRRECVLHHTYMTTHNTHNEMT